MRTERRSGREIGLTTSEGKQMDKWDAIAPDEARRRLRKLDERHAEYVLANGEPQGECCTCTGVWPCADRRFLDGAFGD